MVNNHMGVGGPPGRFVGPPPPRMGMPPGVAGQRPPMGPQQQQPRIAFHGHDPNTRRKLVAVVEIL